MLARSSEFWLDDCWIVDSTPVPCGMSRPTVARSELAGWAGWAGREFETLLGEYGITMLRPSRKDETTRFGEPVLKKVRQLIESVNDTLKGQLDLEHHGGRSCQGVAIRVAQRVLAMAAAIWHNHTIGAPITRSLIAYDH